METYLIDGRTFSYRVDGQDFDSILYREIEGCQRKTRHFLQQNAADNLRQDSLPMKPSSGIINFATDNHHQP